MVKSRVSAENTSGTKFFCAPHRWTAIHARALRYRTAIDPLSSHGRHPPRDSLVVDIPWIWWFVCSFVRWVRTLVRLSWVIAQLSGDWVGVVGDDRPIGSFARPALDHFSLGCIRLSVCSSTWSISPLPPSHRIALIPSHAVR
jgi:hypothetical protein